MYKQLTDMKLKEITKNVELKESKYFVLIDSLLFRKYKNKDLFVVPESMVNTIIRLNHDEIRHVDVEKTIYGITSHYWFPCLKLKVRQYIDKCIKCLSCSLAAGKSEGKMEIIEKRLEPFQTLYIDYFRPLNKLVIDTNIF